MACSLGKSENDPNTSEAAIPTEKQNRDSMAERKEHLFEFMVHCTGDCPWSP
jgi:hypothetical protein